VLLYMIQNQLSALKIVTSLCHLGLHGFWTLLCISGQGSVINISPFSLRTVAELIDETLCSFWNVK
jgi:hypothetical protein